MKSDIEIARSVELKKIKQVAESIGIPRDEVENYGRYIAKIPEYLIDEEKVHHAEEYFRKHGAASTFFGRLIPAVRLFISIRGGLGGINFGPFLLYTTLGAGIWNAILALLGYIIYRFTDIKTTNDVYILATKYSHEIGYVIIAVTVLIVGFLIYKGAKQKK